MPERKIAYDRISIQKDVGLLLTAPSYERLFIDTALASTDFRFPLELIETAEQKRIEVKAKSLAELMAIWLQAVFALSQQDKFLPKRIVFEKFDGTSIKASLHGEKHNALKHGGNDSVTAVVCEGIRLGEAKLPESGFTVQVQYRAR